MSLVSILQTFDKKVEPCSLLAKELVKLQALEVVYFFPTIKNIYPLPNFFPLIGEKYITSCVCV